MSNSQISSRSPRFAILALVVILASAGALALLVKPLTSADRGVVYHLALTNYNHHYDTATITDLNYYHPKSLKSLNLETKAKLEEGSAAAAIGTAQQAHGLDPSDQTTTLLLGTVYALANQQTNLATLIASQTDSKTVQALQNLKSGNIAQAQELYLLGLLKSSQTALAKVRTPSVQSSILQAQVALGLQPGKTGALKALPFTKMAVALDPSSLDAQKLFISVSRETGDTTAANQHQTLLNLLTSGRP